MKTKTALVIGNSVSKSLSPIIFNYWFSKYSINGKYDYKEIKTENFRREIKQIFKKNNIYGLNITIPFKEKIIPYLDDLDEHAKKIGAVNCVTIKKNKIYGSNTDWTGYTSTLKEKTTKQDRVNKKAIIIGYGGAAKAILYALLKLEYKKIYVFNRTLKKISNLKNTRIEPHLISEINDYIKFSSLIINTTPINIFKNSNTSKTLPPNVVISDVVYKPTETNFLRFFKNPKHKTYGISMLINQAIPCFKKWFGVLPIVDEGLLEIIKKETNK